MAEWLLHRRFHADGGTIAWDHLGKGPPVVLVHGTPWSSWTWRRIASRLAQRHRVYVFDLLGYGASEQRAGQDLSLAAQRRRLAPLLDVVTLRPWGSPFYRLVEAPRRPAGIGVRALTAARPAPDRGACARARPARGVPFGLEVCRVLR